jgi:hypothetical protein
MIFPEFDTRPMILLTATLGYGAAIASYNRNLSAESDGGAESDAGLRPKQIA